MTLFERAWEVTGLGGALATFTVEIEDQHTNAVDS